MNSFVCVTLKWNKIRCEYYVYVLKRKIHNKLVGISNMFLIPSKYFSQLRELVRRVYAFK